MTEPEAGAMNQHVASLRATPLRFFAVALVGAALLAVVGQAVQWLPWATNRSILADGWGDGVHSISVVVWTVAPVLALRLPRLAGSVAALPFAATVVDAEPSWPITLFLALVLCAMVAAWESRRAAVVLGIAALVPVLTYSFGFTVIRLPYGVDIDSQYSDPRALALTFLLYAVAVTLALATARWMRSSYLRTREAAGLAARADDVEREAAVLGERARLARDLHDVVAHHVSLIAVRAETAPYTVPDLSPAGRTLLAAIADDSRRALDELRGVLGILRRSGEDPAPAPQPTASDIALLVESARDGGDDIEWEPADLSVVETPAGYAAYRVVQEALTNARRHAPGTRVLLETLVEGSGDLVVRVGNPATGAAAGEGRGLAGMRERVEALGGRLTVDRSADAVFVEARIPRGAARDG